MEPKNTPIPERHPNKMELDPFDFIAPEKDLDIPATPKECHNCGCANPERLFVCDSKAWSRKYWCQDCGRLNYIIFSDKMGGVSNDTVRIFKIHPRPVAKAMATVIPDKIEKFSDSKIPIHEDLRFLADKINALIDYLK